MTTVANMKMWTVLVVGALGAAVVAMVGVTLSAGMAVAATPTRATIEATDQFSVSTGETGEAFAVCPGTKRALGGGVVQSGSAQRYFFLNASGPLDNTGVTANTKDGDIAKQWYAAVEAHGGPEQITFKVFAICSDTSNATIEATPFTVEPGDPNSTEKPEVARAVCPGTKRALGGGVVESGPPDNLQVHASGPLDSTGLASKTTDGDIAKQWYAAVENRTGAPVKFKVFAICSGTSNATIEATPFTVEPDPSGNGKFAEGYAVCPGAKRALGGGVVQSGSPDKNLVVQASGPLDHTGITAETNDGDIAKQWYTVIGNYWGEQPPLKVFAICE